MWAWARPPSRAMKWPSDHSTFIGGSTVRDGISSGRRPAINERSAVRAAVLADRTAAKVAIASTRVPPAVASDEIVAQSAIGDEAKCDHPPPTSFRNLHDDRACRIADTRQVSARLLPNCSANAICSAGVRARARDRDLAHRHGRAAALDPRPRARDRRAAPQRLLIGS